MNKNRFGFQVNTVYKLRRPSAFHYARHRFSFLIAVFALIAFVTGNMVGQHGWYAFWKSVLGKEMDISTVEFAGFAPPLAYVASDNWAMYGGDPTKNTADELPPNMRVPLPPYDPAAMRDKSTMSPWLSRVFCTGQAGDYKLGNDHAGAHPGVDICRTPIDEPVLSIGNGIVRKAVDNQNVGYGHYVVIEHPMPNPDDPKKPRTVFSIYGHMNQVLVTEGMVVNKGQQIGTVGKTGFATNYHLHFQIDKGKNWLVDGKSTEPPWHPYWPFTSTEMAQAGLTFTQAIDAGLHKERIDVYTLSPLVLVQQYESFTAPSTVIAASSSSSEPPVLSEQERMALLKAGRLQARLARRQLVAVNEVTQSASASASSSAASQTSVPAIPVSASSVGSSVQSSATKPSTDVADIQLQYSPTFSSAFTVKLVAVGQSGDVVAAPAFKGNVQLSAVFDNAGFSRSTFTAADFLHNHGKIIVSVKPLSSKRPVVLQLSGVFSKLSEPIVFESKL